MTIKLRQSAALPTRHESDRHQNWIVVFAGAIDSSYPYAEVLSKCAPATPKEASPLRVRTCDLPNDLASHVAFVRIDAVPSSFELLTLARALVAQHHSRQSTTLAMAVVGFDAGDAERIAEAVLAAALAATADLPCLKRKPPPKLKLTALRVYGVKAPHRFKRTFAEAEGNALARALSMLPANRLTPSLYLRRIKTLAADHRWRLEFYDEKALRARKAGAFLAVCQGSPTRDAGVVRLRYQPPTRPRKDTRVVLIGKGICYDTGGTNLKPARHMFGMHEDMQGSAVAVGTLLALSALQVDFSVECWLALAMNHIGPNAYKPNDVVTAADGTTIEIVHTDAEGRLVLADTLVLASRTKPHLIIDYATLTGACVYSLGNAYSGVFSNRDACLPHLINAGQTSGERVWPFPLDADYDEALESTIADIKQCALEGNADHILAARFLRRFVKHDTPWIHVDLSSSSHKGGLAHIPTDTTGFGVRLTLDLLLKERIVKTLIA